MEDILDHHHVWQSHELTSIQNFDFCERTSFLILLFLQTHPNSSNFVKTQKKWVQLESILILSQNENLLKIPKDGVTMFKKRKFIAINASWGI